MYFRGQQKMINYKVCKYVEVHVREFYDTELIGISVLLLCGYTYKKVKKIKNNMKKIYLQLCIFSQKTRK